MSYASVTIDAGVLAVPSLDDTTEDAHHYVETILDWSKLLEDPWVAIYMSERASESLFSDDFYPLRRQLEKLFAAQGVVEYDVNTVATVIDRLLQLTPSFEAYFCIHEVLHENLVLEPDILKLCSGDTLKSDLARCVVLIAILRHHCQDIIGDHSMIIRRATERIVKVRAVIHELEHSREELQNHFDHEVSFDGDVLVCDDFRGLIDCLDEDAILLKANDEVGVKTAIQVAYYKSEVALGPSHEWEDLPDYHIGGEFRASLENHSTRQFASNLLRTIIDTLKQNNMAATHAIRTGRGGNNPQLVRKRDKAKAWRRDIASEYHLHYWICDNGTVEFASISFPHDDFNIPE